MKELKDYTDRELLEFVVSNQVRIEQQLNELINKQQIHLDDAYNNLLDSSTELNRQIKLSKD